MEERVSPIFDIIYFTEFCLFLFFGLHEIKLAFANFCVYNLIYEYVICRRFALGD